MQRRDLLKQFGAGLLALISSPGWTLSTPDGPSYLLEAEHFRSRGGWTLDTQFHDELGFSYLLAHGLGDPVEDATTRITLPETGTYHVWIRTKDWVPGDWEAPGRFDVSVDGRSLGTFGTEAGWGWRKAGPIEVGRREVAVTLHDRTGFDGRCDAIYFSKDPQDVPPNERETLTEWRRAKNGLSDGPREEKTYDLVIAGGGLAGCAAALAANEKGREVALIQDRPVLGGNASSEIRVHTLGIKGQRADILEQIDTPHYENGSPEAKAAEEKRHENMRAADHVDLFLGHTVYEVHAENSAIRAIDALEFETGLTRRFRAPYFIDCTGDGWLGYWAGADFRYGRESRHEFDEGWDRHGALWSPEEPDDRVMGSSVLWRSEERDHPVEFPEVPWAMPVARNHAATSGEWYWEYSADDVHQIEDAEHVRDHMLRAIYGSFANAKKDLTNARLDLSWVSHLVGKRESRRLMGDHIYTMNDALEGRDFPDAVVTEKREVDVHYQRKRKGHPVDFLAEAMFRKPRTEFYHVPFRSLYSRDIENLLMAGRCFSCSHIGLGGPRVMRTCGQMGVATGFGAHLCLKYDTTPREVGRSHAEELRSLCGYT